MPLETTPGLKESELVALGPCRVCGKLQLAVGDPTFYVVEVRRAIFDRSAIQRRVGLEMMLGSGPLATVMGPDEDIAKVFAGPTQVFVHESCAHGVYSVLELMPKAEEEKP